MTEIRKSKMKLENSKLNCQIPCLKYMDEGVAEPPALSIYRRIKLNIRRILSPNQERSLKNYTNKQLNRLGRLTGNGEKPSEPLVKGLPGGLHPGDIVRVRSLREIRATMNHWGQVKGCGFMPEMAEFCGTTQKVFKRMDRFVDERDLNIKKANGIIFLENVICKGAKDFGICDRACFHFWREEWLEKIDTTTPQIKHEIEKRSLENGMVQVRSLEDIEATLDDRRQLKGCAFLPEMANYCGTKQKVLKRMHRYIDESELRAKKANGIVLLDSVICQGIGELSSCDRACFYLWREEWLQELGAH
jgi:hypothetical protein